MSLRSHPTGSVTHETLTTTLSFVRSDKQVYTTVSIRPFSPCHPTQAMPGPIVSHIRSPYPAFPGGVHGFRRCLYQGLGRLNGGFPTCSESKLHINVLELKAVILALQHWVSVLQSHHVMIAIDNTTVVAYFNKQGGAHSHALLGWGPFPRPVVAGSRSVSMATDYRYSHLG